MRFNPILFYEYGKKRVVVTPIASVSDYVNRVNSAGGTVIDIAYLNTEYTKLVDNNLNSTLLYWHNSKLGMKKDVSNNIEKLYSFTGEVTDIISTIKPIYEVEGIRYISGSKLERNLSVPITTKTFSIILKVKAVPSDYFPVLQMPTWNTFCMHSASGGMLYAGIQVNNRFELAGAFLNNITTNYTFTYNSITKIAKIYRDVTLLGTITTIDPITFTDIKNWGNNGYFYDQKMFSKELTLSEIIAII